MKWYEAKPKRLTLEITAIKQVYPSAKAIIEKGRLIVFLNVQGEKTVYLLKVVYPIDFPYDEPKAYVFKPRIKDAPHRWRDGSLCFEGDAEPPNLSGRIVLDWSVNWLKVFENWLDGKDWPDRIRGQ